MSGDTRSRVIRGVAASNEAANFIADLEQRIADLEQRLAVEEGNVRFLLEQADQSNIALCRANDARDALAAQVATLRAALTLISGWSDQALEKKSREEQLVGIALMGEHARTVLRQTPTDALAQRQAEQRVIEAARELIAKSLPPRSSSMYMDGSTGPAGGNAYQPAPVWITLRDALAALDGGEG